MWIEDLEAVLRTLNAVQVSGRSNLDYLLGSIQTIEKIIMSMQEELQNGGEH